MTSGKYFPQLPQNNLDTYNNSGGNLSGAFNHIQLNNSINNHPYTSNIYPGMTTPINISVPPASLMTYGASAPASLTYERVNFLIY